MNELDSKFKKELDNEDIRFLKEYGKNINKLMKFASKYKPLSVAAMEDEFNKIKKSYAKTFARIFEQHGFNCFNMGRLHAKYEVIAAGRPVKDFKKLEPLKLAEPLPGEMSINFWLYPEKAIEAIKRRQLVLSGNVTDDVIEAVKNIMREKIKGAGELEVEKQIASTIESSMDRAELISITESTYYYNKGRITSFYDDGVEYIQFSAVMDGRTSEQCRSRHGLIMRTDSAELAMNTPPLHGRCRSILKPYFEKPSEKQMDWSMAAPLPPGWRVA
ncbi:phage head morphogenesis protein [Clostridium chromiireducens]|uniref:Phage head morphogenesis protein n=1 Tax=Clostridium chromiireducens TaxID=225345 RepID=A0A399IMR9_9CLOT|nr:minor capsid protein [Clostridium chromiireducens]RII34315.1 phage head morphogenesis protein [Clostridium chromiireducens]